MRCGRRTTAAAFTATATMAMVVAALGHGGARQHRHQGGRKKQYAFHGVLHT
jgi:hypothetical protein